MNDDNDILADPWLKTATQSTSLPDNACFACAYGLFEGGFPLEEATFFRRTETADELWIATGMALSIVDGAADGTAGRVDGQAGRARRRPPVASSVGGGGCSTGSVRGGSCGNRRSQ